MQIRFVFFSHQAMHKNFCLLFWDVGEVRDIVTMNTLLSFILLKFLRTLVT